MAGKIRVEVDDGLSLVIFRVPDDASLDDFDRAIRDHFPRHPTDNAMWDLTKADLSWLDRDGIERIAEAALAIRRYRRPDGRTAIVAGDATERVLLKIYPIINELQGSTIRYRIFEHWDEALRWIRRESG